MKNRMHWSKRQADTFVVCGTVVLVAWGFVIPGAWVVIPLGLMCFFMGRWVRAQVDE